MPAEGVVSCGICLGVVAVILVLVLVPLSFSYVDYYDYGLVQRKSTGSVDTGAVYASGRYALGPDRRFLKYQADAHVESFERLGVFSTAVSNVSIGLSFEIDVDLTYFLNEDEIGDVHRELASNYGKVIRSRAREAIKNAAAESVSFSEFFQERKRVEALFRSAVEERWSSPPSLHCRLDQFHLGRIRIPESVASKQLEARVQIEKNDREGFLQRARVEREMTSTQVRQVDLRTKKELRTADARASLVRTRAQAEAELMRAQAGINGTRMLLEAAGIETQDHKTAFQYIRTLRDRKQLEVDVSYLLEDSVVRTKPV